MVASPVPVMLRPMIVSDIDDVVALEEKSFPEAWSARSMNGNCAAIALATIM